MMKANSNSFSYKTSIESWSEMARTDVCSVHPLLSQSCLWVIACLCFPLCYIHLSFLAVWPSHFSSNIRGKDLQTLVKATQLCLIFCNTIDYTVCGILQARVLEWVAYPFSRRSSQPRNWTGVSCTAGGFSTSWATREALILTNSHTDTNKLPQLSKVKYL